MSKPFSIDEFKRFGSPTQTAIIPRKEGEFSLDEFKPFPGHDVEEANKEPEGTGMATIRNLLQIPKGLANLNPVGAGANILNAMGTGEASSGLQEDFTPERIEELKKKFPNAPWERYNEKDFKEKYLKGMEGAQKYFPTVENISRGIESATGIPLESKGLGHEIIQLGMALTPALFARLTSQPSRFSSALRGLTPESTALGRQIPQRLGRHFSQEQIVAEGRRIGLTDEEIAPLLNSQWKTRLWARLARKGTRSQDVLRQTQQGIGRAYDLLRDSEVAAQPFAEPLQRTTLANLYQRLRDLPAIVRHGIIEDTQTLLRELHLNPRNLMRYRQNIQATIRSDPERYGQLSRLIGVIDEALLNSSPQFARAYHGINRLYEQFARISRAMRPTTFDMFIRGGEALAAIRSIVTLNVPLMTSIAGEAAARSMARELLINPHFQQLGTKLVHALNRNQIGLAAKIAESMSKKIRPYSEKMADEIDDIDWKKASEKEKS